MSLLGGSKPAEPDAAGTLKKDTDEQTGDQREDAIRASRGVELTATGQARAQLDGREDARIAEIENRGSDSEIAGGDKLKADLASAKPRGLTNAGAQTEPAAFVVNGTQPPATVASPSGPQPVGLTTSTLDEATKVVQERRDEITRQPSAMDELSDEFIASADAATLRAVAANRGKHYDSLGHVGTRQTRELFRQLQSSDPRFKKGEVNGDRVREQVEATV